MKKNFWIFASAFLLFGCASRTTPAPIVNVTQAPDYSQNNSNTPSSTKSDNSGSGTKLGSVNENQVKTVPAQQTIKPIDQANATPAVTNDTLQSNSTWISPTNGAITRKFTPASKGEDYTGKLGQSIVAVNDGKVVYSGDGLKGYGNLIIIKHDKTYLSAYANNQTNLVKEGDVVKRGQKIATMGKGVDGKPLLHFEIRQNGKPIDPTTLVK